MKEKILPIEVPDLNESIYAGFWRRFGAFWMDFVIFGSLNLAFSYINELGRLNAFYTFIPQELAFFIYNIYLIKIFGGTPGKLLLKVKVIKKNGEKVGWREAILREIVIWVLNLLITCLTFNYLLSITDAGFLSIDSNEQFEEMMKTAPFDFYFLFLIMNIWIWSEFIILLMNRRKRALHDYIAGTVVIKKKYEKIAEQIAVADGEKDRILR